MDWDKIQEQWEENAVVTDKEDLLSLLALRFGSVPAQAKEEIRRIADSNALERLILVAANVPTWDAFAAELKECRTAFRITGTQYQPF